MLARRVPIYGDEMAIVSLLECVFLKATVELILSCVTVHISTVGNAASETVTGPKAFQLAAPVACFCFCQLLVMASL